MTITSTNSTVSSASHAAAPVSLPTKPLTQADFLKLLTVQLAQQDPLKPMDDTAFVGQMAQFTSLQQTADMGKQLAALAQTNALASGVGLLGREVQVQTDSDRVTGTVSAVDNSADAVRVEINGTLYPLAQVIAVGPAPVSSN